MGAQLAEWSRTAFLRKQPWKDEYRLLGRVGQRATPGRRNSSVCCFCCWKTEGVLHSAINEHTDLTKVLKNSQYSHRRGWLVWCSGKKQRFWGQLTWVPACLWFVTRGTVGVDDLPRLLSWAMPEVECPSFSCPWAQLLTDFTLPSKWSSPWGLALAFWIAALHYPSKPYTLSLVYFSQHTNYL